MSIVKRTFVLTGCRKGMTCRLNHGRFQFVDGKITLEGDGEKIAGLVGILENQYQAYEVGDPRLETPNEADTETDPEPNAEPTLVGGDQPNGPADEAPDDGAGSDGTDEGDETERLVSEGNGHSDPRLERITVALGRLDRGKDAHWTKDGQPKVSVVAAFAKIEDLMRADILKAAPNFQREG